ncbi:MAG: PfkB family carbohydrate kinase, partial [Burkholderiales bacterium]
DAGIPFIFDPGQGMPMFDGEELMNFIGMADYVTVNDYEAKMLQEKTGKKVEELAKRVTAFIVTLGAEGSLIYSEGREIRIPVVEPEAVVDPTGCGDAYRAGLLYGISSGFDWYKTGRLASLLGSIKIAKRGGQNHELEMEEIRARYRSAFGTSLD